MTPDIILFPGGEVWVSTYSGSLDFIPLEVMRAEGYSPPRGPRYGTRTGRSSRDFGSAYRQAWGFNRDDESFDRGRDNRPMTPEEKQDWYDQMFRKGKYANQMEHDGPGLLHWDQ